MTEFSFDATAGTSQSTAKPRLPGNDIYEVVFDGCEIKDIQGVKEADKVYKCIDLKFTSGDGVYEHRVWEPRPEDFKRTEREFTNKNGKIEKIPQPSGLESTMLFFKHAIDTLNPTVAKQIDDGERKIGAPNWDKLRDLICTILNAGKGTTTKIKLLKNNKGEATFPGFFAAVNREGKAYVRNNFIGPKIAFTSYEVDRIKNEKTAKPTEASDLDLPEDDLPGTEGLDLTFNVQGL